MRTFLPLIVFIQIAGAYLLPYDPEEPIDYRQEMRFFVQEIAEYSRDQHSSFIIIPQNGHELVINNKGPALEYLNAISGLAQESLFYGYPDDNQSATSENTNYLLNLLNVGHEANLPIFVTDYCSTAYKIYSSFSQNQQQGFISFAAPQRELHVIPDIPDPLPNQNDDDIHKLSEVNNFLYLLNKKGYETKKAFIQAIQETNYDLIIIDAYYREKMFSPEDIEQLKIKKNGGKRLVVSYLSIGEAEDYRPYWHQEWTENPPEWLVAENPDWEGNYKVKYWQPQWKQIITGNVESYNQKILDAGFDGVYLDIIDAFNYFE
ncbi:MAG: hypothetical protein FH748_09490 [Balneolaceae bacterium]|nr:hypothetical protein [Balneolaceae bacterium]